MVNSPQKLEEAQTQINEIAALFGSTKSLDVQVVAEIDTIADEVQLGLLQTPFVPLGDGA